MVIEKMTMEIADGMMAGLLSNGTVISRLGTAVVAMMAESQDLPVLTFVFLLLRVLIYSWM